MSKETTPKASECCQEHPCDSGLRNNYFDGKPVTPAMYRVEQSYLLERRRLLNRAIHGWGVVYGMAVTVRDGCLIIGKGLALDECGRELLQVTKLQTRLADLLELGNRALPRGKDGAAPKCWLLSAHYAERNLDPVPVKDRCNCEHTAWDHVCETVRYSLTPCDCKDSCGDGSCELQCECPEGACCEKCGTRRGDRCLCEHLTGQDYSCKGGRLCEIEESCGGVIRVDLTNSVKLACVKLTNGDCDEWSVESIDACGPRRLVKRNDLLFDLIQGCDLTHIARTSWEAWHRGEVAFEQFQAALPRDFWIEFSRPVRAATVRPDCFAITALLPESKEHWLEPDRVPIDRIETTPAGAEFIQRAQLVFGEKWLTEMMRETRPDFVGIEIEVYGDFIADCNGRTIDANPVGLSAVPTGNGTPGGTYRSGFRIAAQRSTK